MLEWWTELPPWLRLMVAGVLIVVGVVCFAAGAFRAGCVLVGVGCVLIMFGGPSDAEKKGYRF